MILWFKCIKINDIANNFLLAGDRVMSEMRLKQLGFTYSTCDPFSKNKERIQKFMKIFMKTTIEDNY